MHAAANKKSVQVEGVVDATKSLPMTFEAGR